MNRINRLAICLGLAMLGGTAALVSAQDQPAAAPGQSQPAPSPAPSPAASKEQAEVAPARDASDDVFIPTEEIPADEEVTFPVDI